MLSQKRINDLIDYWILTSEEDLKTMEAMYKARRYAFCLFVGHLILEKALKALVIRITGAEAPRTHNLPYLFRLAELDLVKEDKELLENVDTFNLQTRYPDEQFEFSQQCNKSFTDRYYDRIISLYKKLCRQAKPEN